MNSNSCHTKAVNLRKCEKSNFNDSIYSDLTLTLIPINNERQQSLSVDECNPKIT